MTPSKRDSHLDNAPLCDRRDADCWGLNTHQCFLLAISFLLGLVSVFVIDRVILSDHSAGAVQAAVVTSANHDSPQH
ncbi:MAG: hypothetical protein ACRCUY_04245 [Thermoguttaceae bacterium]